MTNEERNKWFSENIEWFDERVRAMYATRNASELIEYDDLFQQLSEFVLSWMKWKEANYISKSSVYGYAYRRFVVLLDTIKHRNNLEQSCTDVVDELYFINLDEEFWSEVIWNANYLSEREKYIFIQKTFYDYTLDEIGKELRITKEGVRMRYKKACRKICKKLFFKEGTKFRVRYKGPILISAEVDGQERYFQIHHNSECFAENYNEAKKIFTKDIVEFFDISTQNPKLKFKKSCMKFVYPYESDKE